MKTARKNKNKTYKGACCMSLSLSAALTTFAYNCTSEKYRDSLVAVWRAAWKMVNHWYFRMMGLTEKSFSDNKTYLLSSSSSIPVLFPFSILQWYLGSLIGWLKMKTGEWKRQCGRWVLRNRPRKQPGIRAYLWLALRTGTLVTISAVLHWICQMYSLSCVTLPSICYIRV